MAKPDLEIEVDPEDQRNFDPDVWDRSMGNLFWRTALHQPEHSDWELTGVTQSLLGRKGYLLEFHEPFIASITSSSAKLPQVNGDAFNPTERAVFTFPEYAKTKPHSIERHMSEVAFSTFGSVSLAKARYLGMKDAFMKLGNFPPDLFDQELI